MSSREQGHGQALKLAHCKHCGAYSFPADSYGCRVCGSYAAELEESDLPGSPVLVNFVTMHAELSADLDVPCVIGEAQLAPGVIEEAIIDVDDEEQLQIGMALEPVAATLKSGKPTWKFVPAQPGKES